MSTIVKILLTICISIFLTSCHMDINFGEGERGNGNVVTETRNVDENFTSVIASEGLDVYVSQDDNESIKVEADDNIIGLIRTDIKNGVLKVHTEKRIGRAKSKKVYISLSDITSLKSNSGADLYGASILKGDRITLKSSSGADLKVEVEANEVDCSASSGADLIVSGSANVLYADASSGSDIKAGRLVVEKCIAEATSGADVRVNATKEVSIKSNSGGDVHYSGEPATVKKH